MAKERARTHCGSSLASHPLLQWKLAYCRTDDFPACFFYSALHFPGVFLYDFNRAVKITACGGGCSCTSRLRAAFLLQHLLPMNGWRTRPNEGDTGCERRTWLSAHLAALPSRTMASGLSSLLHCKPGPKDGLLCPMTCRRSFAPSSLKFCILPFLTSIFDPSTLCRQHMEHSHSQPADDLGFWQVLFYCSLTGQWGWTGTRSSPYPLQNGYWVGYGIYLEEE